MEPINKDSFTIDVGNLFREDGNPNFISKSRFKSFFTENHQVFESFVETLKNKTSPITLSFIDDASLERIRKLGAHLREKYKNMLVIGIGGSTLGFRAILQTLKGPYYNFEAPSKGLPRVFVLDNIDPFVVESLENILDFKETAIVYITKSGSTPESAANFLYFYRKYIDAGGNPKDLVFICDEGENGINRIGKKIECNLLHIPKKLGGRYSVLSSVGFLPGEFIGLDSREFLEGAKHIHNKILSVPPEQNAVFILGSCISELTRRGKVIHTLFNYSNMLFDFGLWFAQLWGESLGKKLSLSNETVHTGSIPLVAQGATDQHSLLQLFKEGPLNTIFGFVTIDQFPPEKKLQGEFPGEKEYSYFEGHTIGELLHTEQMTTEISLVNAQRPCYRVSLPGLSEYTLGGLFYFYEALVPFIAKLWNINPFDQPGVEEGKNMTYALMGRQDYASSKPSVEKEVKHFKDRNNPLTF